MLPVPKQELEESGLTAASLFFSKVFGNSGTVRGLNFLIALSAFGNIMAVIIGLSRRIRECGRYDQIDSRTQPMMKAANLEL